MGKFGFAALVLAVVMLSGCVTTHSPTVGALFTETAGPVAVGPGTSGMKVGEASATSILALIAMGDASISAAMKAGGITKVHHVDFKSKNILGIYGEFTTVVYGE